MKKYFYDVHCHAMNMSHPNFLAFLKRLEDILYTDTDKFLKKNKFTILFAGNILLIRFLFFKKFDHNNVTKLLEKLGLEKYPTRAKNLLATMENDAGSFFLLMEECLTDDLVQNGKLLIVPYAFKTIIKNKLLCSTFNQILC